MNEFDLPNLLEAGNFFLIGFLELSVLFLGLSFLIEILGALVTPRKIQYLLSSKKSGYFLASLLGSVTPFCSCSSIPLMLGLLKARAGFGPIMTFLFTSPILNPVVLVVFFVTFGLELTVMYAFVSFTASLMAGYMLEKLGFERYVKKEDIVDVQKPSFATTAQPIKNAKFSVSSDACSENTKSPKCCDKCCSPECCDKCCDGGNCCSENTKSPECSDKSSAQKVKFFDKQIAQKVFRQFMSFVPYIAIGIGIGAFIHGFVPDEVIREYALADNVWAVPFSAIIGIPLYIRASTMIGLGPELIESGVSMGSVLALTIAGAGASLPEMIMLKKIFKLPIMIAFILVVFTMAIGCGYLVNIYFG